MIVSSRSPLMSSVLFAVVALGAAITGCGLESSLVGGECSDGFTRDGSLCVAPGRTSVSPTDPPLGDATPPAAAPSPTFPSPPEALPSLLPPPWVPSLEVPPPLVLPPGPLVCAVGTAECHGECIPMETDSANCGACGKRCASNICIDGACVGSTPGDVVLIGQDFGGGPVDSAHAKVLVNALSIPTTDPIRVLSYEVGANGATVGQTRDVANQVRGRTVQFTVATGPADLTSATLAQSYDVVLLHDVAHDDASITSAGTWASPLATFTEKGGVVIALDHGDSRMPELVTATGLLTVTSHTKLPEGTHLVVSAPSDVLGAQLVSPYAAYGAPVSFQGTAGPGITWVVRATSGGAPTDPVVLHRVVAP